MNEICAIRILTASHLALPLAEIKDGGRTGGAHRDLAERGVGIVASELGAFGRVRRNRKEFAFRGYRGVSSFLIWVSSLLLFFLGIPARSCRGKPSALRVNEETTSCYTAALVKTNYSYLKSLQIAYREAVAREQCHDCSRSMKIQLSRQSE